MAVVAWGVPVRGPWPKITMPTSVGSMMWLLRIVPLLACCEMPSVTQVLVPSAVWWEV
jgi:hypothetical protein